VIDYFDAPLPGIGNWDKILLSPLLWHFNFRGPDEERLVQGRERIYLDRFYNELSADPSSIDAATRDHYAALYAKSHAMHDAFEQFGAFSQDAIDNKALLAKVGKLTMPVLAIGAEKSFGAGMADELRFVASNVTGAIVPHSGHWIMEENPQATTTIITVPRQMRKPITVLSAIAVASASAAPLAVPQIRLTPTEISAIQAHESGAGTSGVAGIRTTVIAGDPTKDGSYTIRLSVPANTKIQAHTHRNSRTAIVISSMWYFGYGQLAASSEEKALPAGSFYTEPGGVAHFHVDRASGRPTHFKCRCAKRPGRMVRAA
jgi:quercetin dioxygenase-like cupin family protein